jgi:hypothetical protein
MTRRGLARLTIESVIYGIILSIAHGISPIVGPFVGDSEGNALNIWALIDERAIVSL